VDLSLTQDQQNIREAILKLCSRFTDDYWLERDRDAVYPHDFHKSIAEAGWLGIAMPESVGGAGLGITEAAIMMQAVAESGGGMTAASSIHGPVFSLEPIARFGTQEQQQRMIPPILTGEQKMCFAVTEPMQASTRPDLRCERCDSGYRVNGEKIWITNAHVADKRCCSRTTALDQFGAASRCSSPISTGRRSNTASSPRWAARDQSNMLFINDLLIPEADRISAGGDGFRSSHGLNPERILLAPAIGLGRVAIQRAARYARDASCSIGMTRASAPAGEMLGPGGGGQPGGEAATHPTRARLWRRGKCGKYPRRGLRGGHTAMLTLGGMGLRRNIVMYLREVLIEDRAGRPHMI
jgi:acyl-CoA dehydrogenase